ncbi:MAG TPA: PASTA domain-containing protein [Micromonosporaceae bacterium]|nr:PASTA domain-containing protein [Micromonosporaceae bacterium]
MVDVTAGHRSLLALVGALLCGMLVGCGQATAAGDAAGGQLTSDTAAGDVAVPDLAGRPVPDARKIMSAAGLVPVLRTEHSSGPVATVASTDPPAGTVLPLGSVVIVTVRGPLPGWPPTAAERAGAPNLLGLLVERHPDVFVGLGFDGRPDPIVAFNPSVDVAAWRSRLDAAAEGDAYRVRVCPRTGLELAQVEAVASHWPWQAGVAGRFGLVIDPATCSVRLSGDWFTNEDKRRLAERFGDAITIVPGTAARAVG